MAKRTVSDTLRTEEVTRFLPCRLTEDEVRDRALLLAKTTQDIALAEEKATSIKAQLKSELQTLQSQQARLAGTVARGEEGRDVRVRIEYDYAERTVREWREDTGAQLASRPMTELEAQMPLPPM